MSRNDVGHIRVADDVIGIVGLKTVMEEMAGGYGERSDRDCEEELLSRLSAMNYIPERSRQDYGKAFLREFKRFLGRLREEEEQSVQIKPSGPGCACC